MVIFTQYTFDVAFQTKILALLFKDKEFAGLYCEVIKPEFFIDETFQNLARFSLTIIKKTGCVITDEIVSNELDKLFKTPKYANLEANVKQRTLQLYTNTIKNINAYDFSDAAYIRDEAITFAKKAAMDEAIRKSILEMEDISSDKYVDTIVNNIENASIVGKCLNIGFFFNESIKTGSLIDAGLDLGETIPLNSGTLNTFFNGGLRKKHVCLILAATNVGKTMQLVDFGAWFMQQQYTIFHYTLQTTTQELNLRYIANITDYRSNEVLLYRDTVLKKLRNMNSKKAFGDLFISTLQPSSKAVREVRSHIASIKNIYKKKPDIIIIDYLNEMMDLYKLEHTHKALGVIVNELRNLAQEYDVLVLVAAQANREGSKRKTLDIFDIGESWMAAQEADEMIAMCQTEEEYVANYLRRIVLKSKIGPVKGINYCYADLLKQKITDITNNDDITNIKQLVYGMGTVKKK